MKVSNAQWKEQLAGKLPEAFGARDRHFRNGDRAAKAGQAGRARVRRNAPARGTYGQRYDNGQRHDGKKVQEMAYPSGELTKGPMTMWDAPGMQRIKIPGGGMNAEQLETMAELAEEYSDGIAHVTTRQDFQLHYIHIEDTPSLMRRLAAADITTREACGNSVRNVTACPYAGVCQDEVFDVTPYSRALAKFLLGHPDCQNFGRKFKPAFSGCAQHACGLTNLHDLGFIATTRTENGKEKRGFEMYVGGGLGAVPYQAKLFDSFVPVGRDVAARRRPSRASSAGSARRRIATARASSFWCRIWASRNSRNWCWKSARPCLTIRAGRNSSKMREQFEETPLRPPGEWPAAGSEAFQALAEDQHAPAKAEGLRGGHGRAAAGRHHGRISCARLRTSCAGSRRKPCAPPWSRIS